MHQIKVSTVLILALIISACGAPLGTVKYDVQKNPVRKLGIVTFNAPQKIYYDNIKNNTGNAFGIIGVLASSAVIESERDAFQTTLKKQKFDFLKYFIEQLSSSMKANGFQIASIDNLTKDPSNVLNPEEIEVTVASDAIMDLAFEHVGFVSTAGPFSKTQLKPVISVVVSLVAPSTKTIIYRETINYGTWNPFISPTIKADNKYTWESQEAMLKDPASMIAGLTEGSRVLSKYITNVISGKGNVE